MLVGDNSGVLDGIVELLEHCLTQVCSFILAVSIVKISLQRSTVYVWNNPANIWFLQALKFPWNMPDHWKVVEKAKYCPCIFFLATLGVCREIFDCISIAGKRKKFGIEGWQERKGTWMQVLLFTLWDWFSRVLWDRWIAHYWKCSWLILQQRSRA